MRISSTRARTPRPRSRSGRGPSRSCTVRGRPARGSVGRAVRTPSGARRSCTVRRPSTPPRTIASARGAAISSAPTASLRAAHARAAHQRCSASDRPRAGRSSASGSARPRLGARGSSPRARRRTPRRPPTARRAARGRAAPRRGSRTPRRPEAPELARQLGVAGLDRDRATAVSGVAARESGAGAARSGARARDRTLLAHAPVGHLRRRRPAGARLLVLVVVNGPAPGLVIWHVRPLPVLTGLADGLAPKSRRYESGRMRFAPTVWVPRFPSGGDSAADGAHRSSRDLLQPRGVTATPGNVERRAQPPLCCGCSRPARRPSRRSSRRPRRPGPVIEAGRHLAVAAARGRSDRVEHERLGGPQLVEVRADLGRPRWPPSACGSSRSARRTARGRAARRR